jgi:hypothetical protein
MCFLLKAAGSVIPRSVLERPRVAALVAMFPIALLSALLAVVTVADGMSLAVDARLAAVAAAAIALLLRAPFLVVVLVAAVTAAVLRALGAT